jgi:hypothetical protein
MEPTSDAEPAFDVASTKVELQAILWRMRADLERLVAEAGPTRMELPEVAGDWTFKDVIAHLTAWRWWSVARMEGAVKNAEPTPPWGAGLEEDSRAGVDLINQQFYASNRDRSVIEVLRDSRENFDRFETALLALSDAELFDKQRYSWLGGYAAADVVFGSAGHLYEDHVPDIRAFLAEST